LAVLAVFGRQNPRLSDSLELFSDELRRTGDVVELEMLEDQIEFLVQFDEFSEVERVIERAEARGRQVGAVGGGLDVLGMGQDGLLADPLEDLLEHRLHLRQVFVAEVVARIHGEFE